MPGSIDRFTVGKTYLFCRLVTDERIEGWDFEMMELHCKADSQEGFRHVFTAKDVCYAKPTFNAAPSLIWANNLTSIVEKDWVSIRPFRIPWYTQEIVPLVMANTFALENRKRSFVDVLYTLRHYAVEGGEVVYDNNLFEDLPTLRVSLRNAMRILSERISLAGYTYSIKPPEYTDIPVVTLSKSTG